MSRLTEKALADSLIKLLNQYPFEKITVKELVEDCGINRNTFYYHYHDIYALLDDVINQEIMRVKEDNSHYDSWEDEFLYAASFALKNKKALYHIYNSMSRRQIDRYLYGVTGKVMLDYIRSKANGHNISEDDLIFIAEFYKCACVGIVLQWLDNNMKTDAEYIIQKFGTLLEGTADQMIHNAEKN